MNVFYETQSHEDKRELIELIQTYRPELVPIDEATWNNRHDPNSYLIFPYIKFDFDDNTITGYRSMDPDDLEISRKEFLKMLGIVIDEKQNHEIKLKFKFI